MITITITIKEDIEFQNGINVKLKPEISLIVKPEKFPKSEN
jgi:hypothetical protein